MKNTLNNTTTLLSRKEAAKYLGVEESTLAVWSCTKRYNLPYIKVGRLVKYALSELEKFIIARTIIGKQ